jgi:hypothetical protein
MKTGHYWVLVILVLSLVVGIACVRIIQSPASPPATPPAVPPVVQQVTPPVQTPNIVAGAGLPDLTITDAWLDGCTIYYKIKNIGTVDAPTSTSLLYVDNRTPTMGDSSTVDVMKPGQESTLSFSNYQWIGCESGAITNTTQNAGGLGFTENIGKGYVTYLASHAVKVCANTQDPIAEADTTNNCIVKIVGPVMSYDLLPLAQYATWMNSAGDVPDFGSESNPNGGFIKQGDGSLEMIPVQVPQGWTQGYFGYRYMDKLTNTYQTAAIQVPANTHFIATVGLSPNAVGSDGVTFKFGMKDLSDNVNFLPGKQMTIPGQFETWDIDLSDYAGQNIYFILRVEAGSTGVNDFAIWKDARLAQVNN